MSYEGPKFSLGDLVVFKEEYTANMVEGLGIIITEPKLSFYHDWKGVEGFSNEFWTYDVKVGNELFKMIPEEFLKRLGNEN